MRDRDADIAEAYEQQNDAERGAEQWTGLTPELAGYDEAAVLELGKRVI